MLKPISFLLLLSDLCISSCQNYLTRKYELSRPFAFESKANFISLAQKRTGFQKESFYYSDSLGYVKLMKSLRQKNKEGVLWGFYIGNDVVGEMDQTPPDKLYCKKKMEHLVEDFIYKDSLPAVLWIDSTELNSLRLKSVAEAETLLLDHSTKNKIIVLQFTIGFGTYYNDLFTAMKKITNTKQNLTRIIVLCLDPVYTLP